MADKNQIKDDLENTGKEYTGKDAFSGDVYAVSFTSGVFFIVTTGFLHYTTGHIKRKH